MILNGLKNLYGSMKAQEINRYKFIFTYNNINFDVFFFIDEQPHFKLAFGVMIYNFYFELPVKKGFCIDAYLDNYTYNRLVEILQLKPSEDGPYKISYFFEQFNKNIPNKAKKQLEVKPYDIAKYINDVEEADKIYFCGWLDNNKREYQVQDTNLEKTRKWLSYKAYVMCKEKNISSKWTDEKEKAKEFYLPVFE